MQRTFLLLVFVLAFILAAPSRGLSIELLPEDYTPVAIAVDPAGQTIVTFRTSYLVLDASGHLINQVPTTRNGVTVEARGSVLDSGGNLYVAGAARNQQSGTGNDFGLLKCRPNQPSEWLVTYDGAAHLNDGIEALALDSNNNIYVTGVSTGAESKEDVVIICYHPSGAQVWSVVYDNAHRTDIPVALAVDQAQNVYVLAYSDSGTIASDTDTFGHGFNYFKRYVLIRCHYDAENLVVVEDWAVSIPCTRAIALVVDGQSSAYVAVEVMGNIGLIKYGPDGLPVWGKEHGDSAPAAIERPRDLALDETNGFLSVAAIACRPETNGDYLVLKYDLNGTLIGEDPPRENALTWYDSPRALAAGPGGSVYVTGSSMNQLNYDILTRKFGGEQTRFDVRAAYPAQPPVPLAESVLHDLAQSITVDGQGNVYVSGLTVLADLLKDADNNPTTYHHFFQIMVIKYNAALQIQWVYPNLMNAGEFWK